MEKRTPKQVMAEINEEAAILARKSGWSQARAVSELLKANPSLYGAYVEAQRNQVR